MKKYFNNIYTHLFIIGFIMIYVSSNISWGNDRWTGILESDARAYYAYLPAIFIYDDLNFSFFDSIEGEKYYNPNFYYDYRAGYNGKVVNKYYCGTALAELPFFTAAHLITKFSNGDTDGYSKFYPIFINIGAVLYLLLGLFFINRTLDIFNVVTKYRYLTLWVMAFGTNAFYYTIGEPGMSHIFSFAFISILLYQLLKYFETPNSNRIIYISLLLGVITLIRPANLIVILLIPFAARGVESLIGGIKYLFNKYITLIVSVVVFALIASIQLIIYKVSTGDFFVYSYGQEGFNFLKPNILKILFSYKKGLFLYTPIYLVSLFGLYHFFKRSKYEFLTLFSFLFIIIYVFSSWWMWFYGGSFSSRVFVEYIPVFAILMGLALQNIKSIRLRKGYISTIIFLAVICQIQTYQYRYNLIHWSEMNKEKYWNVFMRIDMIIEHE